MFKSPVSFLSSGSLSTPNVLICASSSFPDKDSAALLPHAAGDGPVKELFFSNAEQAASLLLDPATTQKILVKDLLSATGEAMVAIRDYQTVVECDHRWYMARLVSASKRPQIVAGTRENVRFGC